MAEDLLRVRGQVHDVVVGVGTLDRFVVAPDLITHATLVCDRWGCCCSDMQPSHLPTSEPVVLAHGRDLGLATRRHAQRHELVKWTALEVAIETPELFEDAMLLLHPLVRIKIRDERAQRSTYPVRLVSHEREVDHDAHTVLLGVL